MEISANIASLTITSDSASTSVLTTNEITNIKDIKKKIADKLKQAYLEKEAGTVTSIANKKIEAANNDCVFCLTTLLEQPISKTICGHIYHTQCLKNYVKYSNIGSNGVLNKCSQGCYDHSYEITNYSSVIEFVDSNIRYTDDTKNNAGIKNIINEQPAVSNEPENIQQLFTQNRNDLITFITRSTPSNTL